jgi:hypothetical protein
MSSPDHSWHPGNLIYVERMATEMKIMLALLLVPLLSYCLSACGSSGGSPNQTSQVSSAADPARDVGKISTAPVPPGGYLKSDSDNDADEHQKGPSNEDMGEMVTPAHGASNADRRTITAVVKRYYTAAAAGDGALACMLLDPGLATATTQGQAQIAPAAGRSCSASLSRLFQLQHQRLTAEDPATMVVTGVHVDGDAGLATLGFRAMPEGELVLQREGRTWKIDALFDSPLP